MNFYIEIENGTTKNHPAYEDNLIQAFGEVPAHWEPFIRVQPPEPAVYQVFDSFESVYAKVNGVWTDVWSLRNMTDAEKAAKQQAVITAFNAREQADNWSAWIFDEATCTYQPPTPNPDISKYFWQGTTSSWVERPQHPNDGKEYRLDFASATWIEVTP